MASPGELQRRRFGTTTKELRRLSGWWLRELGVTEVVMESTAQYWKPVWRELEPYLRLHLAPAFSNRAPKGRKQDFRDAERLRRRFLAEELILSFVPGHEQRSWRTMTRMKTRLALCGSSQILSAVSPFFSARLLRRLRALVVRKSAISFSMRREA